VPFPGAYIKVLAVFTSKLTNHLTYGIYKEANGRLLKEGREEFEIDLETSNPLRQAYEHLKTLPEFSDATDC
jgi:hypothetical protein